ncbi:MAG: Hsp20/alpha crystallin family protein [bacterium]
MLVRNYPFVDFFTLERDLDRVVGRAFNVARPQPATATAPFVVLPDAEGVTVRAELPGVDPAAIAIAIENHVLTISAERQAEKRESGGVQLQERRFGAFTQSLRLAEDLDAESVTAEAEHGVLTVRVAKRPEAKPRQIEVKVS